MAAGLSSQSQAMPESIPVIDIGGLYSSDPAARKEAAAKLGAACDDIGFFYAVNHNVSVDTIDRAVAMADKFFHLPEAERLKVKADSNNRGYRDIWDSVHRNGKTNAKDSFDLGFPVTSDDPEVKAGTPFYAPNSGPTCRTSPKRSRPTTWRPTVSG
jgi:isopenicillin N synthase-like dioxygenase